MPSSSDDAEALEEAEAPCQRSAADDLLALYRLPTPREWIAGSGCGARESPPPGMAAGRKRQPGHSVGSALSW